MSETTPDPIDAPTGLGEGDPPSEMVEQFGMEAVPAEGPGDEAEGELVPLDEAGEDA
jgi:hypothetical protein